LLRIPRLLEGQRWPSDLRLPDQRGVRGERGHRPILRATTLRVPSGSPALLAGHGRTAWPSGADDAAALGVTGVALPGPPLTPPGCGAQRIRWPRRRRDQPR